MDDATWLAAVSSHAGQQVPTWLAGDGVPPDPGGDERDWPDFTAHAAQAAADGAEDADRRGRQIDAGIGPGYAHYLGAPPVAGLHQGPGGGFGQGEPHDQAAPEPALAGLADDAAGTGRAFTGVGEDELFGLLGARRKLSARQGWELLMTIAEVIRRRPAPGCKLEGPERMPRVWAEGTTGELTVQLAVSRRDADHLLGLAWDLTVKLPLTAAMLRDGIIDLEKAAVIAAPCQNLTREEARLAERILFGAPDIDTMTRNQVKDRIKAAVMEVNPEAADKHREDKAKERRIEVRQEESGNGMIAGRELPCAAVLALDQKISARARELRKLGVKGGLDELRVLAFLERWGQIDPFAASPGNDTQDQAAGSADDGNADDGNADDGNADDGNGNGGNGGPRPGETNPSGGTGGGCACGGAGRDSGIAGWLHLTAPVLTLEERAERPGRMSRLGPVGPAQLRDLAAKMARNPGTTYCLTATDNDGRPVAHGCGKPGPNDRRKRGKPGSPDPPEPGPCRLTLISRGPPGSHGTWRYTTGDREIIFEFEDLAGPCDHRHQAAGHDPGKHLRHLTGILNQHCTQPTCRRPEKQCDYEHSRPYDYGGITCLCTCGPVCRSDHRDKQQPGWKLEEADARGWFRWTTPSGRTYLSGPTVYPI